MNLEPGALAPHFTLLGLDGREYSLPSDRGDEPLLLAFFRVKCATCDVAYPYLNRLRDTYAGGWQLWSVCQDDPRRAADYSKKFALAHPVLLDGAELEVSRLYDPPSTPALYLIGGDGRIEFTSEGFAKDDLNEIGRRIADLAGEKAAEIALADDGNPALKPGCMARQRMPRRRP
jgi:peroxiredoxin